MRHFIAGNLSLLLLVFLPAFCWPAAYYADPAGSGTTCSETFPCALQYAVEGKAGTGDTVYLKDGTYTEISEVDVPVGVSITSKSMDAHRVIIRPGANLPYMVDLYSPSPGSSGAQTIGYLTIDGTNSYLNADGTDGFHKVTAAGIRIVNRNNVRVSNSIIQNITKEGEHAIGIDVYSTQIKRTWMWWKFMPADPQAKGTDTNIDALWPRNPVTNLKIDNNIITNCGSTLNPSSTSERRIYGGIRLFHIKDSYINNNIIDNTSNYSECIAGTMGFLDHVQIYSNKLYMSNYDCRSCSSYAIETWMHKGGTKFYENESNSPFSITVGKDTEIFNNRIAIPDNRQGYAIEATMQSYVKIYGNFVTGANGAIAIGGDAHQDSKPYKVYSPEISYNVLHDFAYDAIRVLATSKSSEGQIILNPKVINNTIDSCDKLGWGSIRVVQVTCGLIGPVMRGLVVKNNIVTNGGGYAGKTIGTIISANIDNNIFYHNNTDDWTGDTAKNTITSDPKYTDPSKDDFSIEDETGSAVGNGLDLGDGFNVGLDATSQWPDRIVTCQHGTEWDVGAYVNSLGGLSYMSPPTNLRMLVKQP